MKFPITFSSYSSKSKNFYHCYFEFLHSQYRFYIVLVLALFFDEFSQQIVTHRIFSVGYLLIVRSYQMKFTFISRVKKCLLLFFHTLMLQHTLPVLYAGHLVDQKKFGYYFATLFS